MRILIYGLNFAPELVGVGKFTGEMAEWLAEHGHQVRVVTAPPFNPTGRVFPGFSSWRFNRSDRKFNPRVTCPERQIKRPARRYPAPSVLDSLWSVQQVDCSGARVSEADDLQLAPPGQLTILRCPLWVPGSSSASKRVMHLASFALTSLWVMLFQIVWKPEVVLVVEPTFLCVPIAQLVARVSGARSWLHVQDFEIDAAFELGFLKSNTLRSVVSALEARCMHSFDRVSTISEKMGLRLLGRDVAEEHYVLFPNWVDTEAIFPSQISSPLRKELGIPKDATVCLYSGTMAHKQGLDILASAVQKCEDESDLYFVFCGDGPAKPLLTKLAEGRRNLRFLPLQPIERLNELFNLADIHLLPQRANAADLVMPSKLTGMLASGRPVVVSSSSDTELSRVVHGNGIVVPPDDAASFAWAIKHLASRPELREQLGRNARACAIANFDKNMVLGRFVHELEGLRGGGSSKAAYVKIGSV